MERGAMLAVCVLCWSGMVCVVTAIQRTDMFPYGSLSGDQILAEGDDETSRVLSLPRPVYFYDSLFSQLYVATNGIISGQDLPMEKQYVDDGFPTDFPVVAPFLADIDTSGGRGQIYYRVTETPSVLNRVAQVLHRGFPDAKFTPTHAVVQHGRTWLRTRSRPEPMDLQTRSQQSGICFSGSFFGLIASSFEAISQRCWVGCFGGRVLFCGQLAEKPATNKQVLHIRPDLPQPPSFLGMFLPHQNPNPPHAFISPLAFSSGEKGGIAGEKNTRRFERMSGTKKKADPLLSFGLFSSQRETEKKKKTPSPVNTFQAVIGYDETDSYVLFLYPEGGLNFFATRPKESYNVEIELPARVGFSRGEVTYLIFSRTEGPYYSATSDEQSVKNLYQVGNTGIPGVWLFHTGNRYSFDNIVPASIGGQLNTPPTGGHGLSLDTTTPEYSDFEEYEDNNFDGDNQEEEDDYPHPGGDPDFQPATAGGHSAPVQPASPDAPSSPAEDSGHRDVPLTSEPRYNPEPAERQYSNPNPSERGPEGRAERTQEQQPQLPLEVVDVYPPHRNEPNLSPGGHVVSVDEDDIDFDTGVIQYTTENKETCARFQQHCSQNAFCSDYATGYCCHCRPGFYGNGRHCLPDGAPQRVSGKVTGTVTVGSTPVEINNIDLHAYIVVGDGRAYTAISEVPEPVGWALMPLAPIGELFGWLFALELPKSQAGFKITGAEFTRRAEVIFYPGNQRLSIIQTGRGLDDHNHLTVDTVLSGDVPFLPPGSEVTMDPFKETYQYYPSVATSTSVREFSVVSAEKGSESFSFQLKQNITYRDWILRYAITNKISPVGVEPAGPDQVNPCYSGSHDCDTTAQCLPQEGQAFQCQCATGYRGDGRNCYDIDECAEGLSSCGAHAQCMNLAGSHRCQCQSGYEFGFDGRTCVDIDECSSSPCHVGARCINGLGSFQCQCQPGLYGDGFQCSQEEGETGRLRSQCEHHRDSLQSGGEAGRPVWEPSSLSATLTDATGLCSVTAPLDIAGVWTAGDRREPEPGLYLEQPPMNVTDQMSQSALRLTVSTTETVCRPPVQRGILVGAYVAQCDDMDSTHHCSAMAPLGIVGVWTVMGRREQEPGLHLAPPPQTVTNQLSQSALRLTVSTTETVCRPPVQRGILSLEPTVMARLDIVGVWIIGGRREQEPGLLLVHNLKTVTDQMSQSVLRLTASTTETVCRPPVQRGILSLRSSCHGSTGHCWCVDSRGQERAGTRTSPGAPPTDCDKPDEPERPKTHCEHHRDGVQTTSPEGYPIVGAYAPQCDANGQYTSSQCHGSSGHCWCVDERGQERTGTRTPPGAPRKDCDRPDEPERLKPTVSSTKTVSKHTAQRDTLFWECMYLSVRLHRTVHVSADEPERPKTHCQHHRDVVQTTSAEGYPVVGAYVPQCDDNGQYISQQCHGSTGHCWCVDNRGQERAGTRTSAGAPPKDCDRPDEPERPKTHCEQQRERAQTTIQEGYPVVGAHVPQCDANGHATLPLDIVGVWTVRDRREQEPELQLVHSLKTVTDQQLHSHIGNAQRASINISGGLKWFQVYFESSPIKPRGSDPAPRECGERWRTSLIEHYGGTPGAQQYVPQCESDGQFSPVQCYGDTTYCWCVDQDGREVPGTRSHDVVKPACLPSVAPPTVRPLPRPDVTPPPNTDITLLYAQGQKIGALPLNGTRLDGARSKTLLTLHGSIVVGLAYDCKDNQVYWTDLSARTINRASIAAGAEPEILINANLVSPEGLAVDEKRRLMFWVDSNPDMIESANLDGSGRRTLFDSDLVNPRAIIVVSSTGTLYWTDWNREAPKIECASVDGQNRKVVVSDGIGLPNALTYDSSSSQVCWADAGKHPHHKVSPVDRKCGLPFGYEAVECVSPDGSNRRVVHPSLNYPFSMVYYRNHFYYTDWRRDGVIAVNKDSSQITDEFLPDQRSHLYGIAIATTQCLSGIVKC
ncbi:hypothetical protein KUCAC02_001004 [Chaenocephalus aceratus]|uniref:Uncharacterized protein n=1 Tax=Chaenocephalus aceratus TaxID=36190 RepID=A0ACB9XVY7_CHAAC|nr:hypothetical protein KUCAC02_001004 [Chaenocephalus aceratus]